jgi:RND family efflux transporter MFP subunit
MNRKMRAKHLVYLGLVFAVLQWGCSEDPPPHEIIRPLLTMRVADADAFAERWFPGRAEATREANIAFEVSGRLVERPTLVGDVVEENQLLARLDPRDFRNALDKAEAALQQAQAYRDRIGEAAKTGAVSQQQLTDAEAALEISRAEVKIRQKALDDSQLRAPFGGTISAILVENFENVRAKQVIMRLLDTSRIEMVVDIPETLISLAPNVKNVRVRFDAFPGREFPGDIKEISNEANPVTRTYPVNIILDQPEGLNILPGMAGAVTGQPELPGDLEETGYEVAITAVVTSDNKESFVWVVDPDAETVTRRMIDMGRLTPRGVIVRGVRAGEVIAVAGVHSLKEGQKVKIEQSGSNG